MSAVRAIGVSSTAHPGEKPQRQHTSHSPAIRWLHEGQSHSDEFPSSSHEQPLARLVHDALTSPPADFDRYAAYRVAVVPLPQNDVCIGQRRVNAFAFQQLASSALAKLT